MYIQNKYFRNGTISFAESQKPTFKHAVGFVTKQKIVIGIRNPKPVEI